MAEYKMDYLTKKGTSYQGGKRKWAFQRDDKESAIKEYAEHLKSYFGMKEVDLKRIVVNGRYDYKQDKTRYRYNSNGKRKLMQWHDEGLLLWFKKYAKRQGRTMQSIIGEFLEKLRKEDV